MTPKTHRLAFALILAGLVPVFCGCGLDFSSDSDGGSSSGTSSQTGSTSSPTTAAQFQSQFLSSSPDNAEPKDVDSLSLDRLPETETAFDSQLGN